MGILMKDAMDQFQKQQQTYALQDAARYQKEQAINSRVTAQEMVNQSKMQTEMIKATYESIKEQSKLNKTQIESNRIIELQLEELKKHNEFLEKQNMEQRKNLMHTNKMFWISLGINTLLLLLNLIAAFMSV